MSKGGGMRKEILKIVLISVMLLTFSNSNFACADRPGKSQKQHKVAVKSSLDWLEMKGVSINRMGQYVTIIIPSDLIFQGVSPHFNSSATDVLKMIIEIIHDWTKMSMEVEAYTANPVQSEKDIWVTNQQAESVAKKLWQLDPDVRLITSNGFGGGHLMKVTSAGSHSINARVVLKFKIEKS